MRRLRAIAALVVIALLVTAAWLILASSRVRHGFDDTAPLAEWLVALGTGGLALATFLLARQARDEAGAVREQAEQVKR